MKNKWFLSFAGFLTFSILFAIGYLLAGEKSTADLSNEGKGNQKKISSLTPLSVSEQNDFKIPDTQSISSINIRDEDRAILKDFYDSTNGKLWKNRFKGYPIDSELLWDFSKPDINPCHVHAYDGHETWYGLQCSLSSDGSHYKIQGLYLGSSNLKGTIPDSLGNLTSLVALNIYDNEISGTIPSALGNIRGSKDDDDSPSLMSKVYIDLSFNNLHGTIPDSLGSIPGLQIITFAMNPLIGGTIPASFCNAMDLNYFESGKTNLQCYPPCLAGRGFFNPGKLEACESQPSYQPSGMMSMNTSTYFTVEEFKHFKEELITFQTEDRKTIKKLKEEFESVKEELIKSVTNEAKKIIKKLEEEFESFKDKQEKIIKKLKEELKNLKEN